MTFYRTLVLTNAVTIVYYSFILIICKKINHSTVKLRSSKMSLTFTLSGKSSILSYSFNPPIYLDEDSSVNYEIGLANFDTFNLIPNVDKSNNIFVWGPKDSFKLEIPVGSYELKDLIEIITSTVNRQDEEAVMTITSNKNTAKVVIGTNRRINFGVENSVGPVLGFNKKILDADDLHHSDEEVRILKINSVCVDCNIATGSYLNSKPVHIIHQFFPTVPYGYKIVESPQNILYYPVSIKTINNLTVKVVDQSGELIDFRGEEITIRLHLRRKTS